MANVNLKAIPYCLSDADIAWVENTIASMTPEEKVGQLFWQLTAGNSEEYLSELVTKYHLGGCRYNGMPGQMVLNQNRILQKNANSDSETIRRRAKLAARMARQILDGQEVVLP